MKPDIENITVFSDASFCTQSKASGGAFWARFEDIKVMDSFSFKGAKKSHEAELMAACNAILRMAKHPAMGPILQRGPKTRLVLVIDCLTIQQVLADNVYTTMSPAARAVVNEVRALQKKLKFWLKVNHVKSHSGTGSPRQWVNNWCDVEARKHMQALRDSIK